MRAWPSLLWPRPSAAREASADAPRFRREGISAKIPGSGRGCCTLPEGRRLRWQRSRDLPTSSGSGRGSTASADGDPGSRPSPFSGRTAWARSVQTPLREFLRTETGGAAVLLAAAAAALVWVNGDASSYDRLWGTTLSIDLGGAEVALDLRGWVNSGLMTFFFFVVGLEARREFDLGELRERRRFAVPLIAGVG